jgi:hypothetical protein
LPARAVGDTSTYPRYSPTREAVQFETEGGARSVPLQCDCESMFVALHALYRPMIPQSV